MIMAEEITTSPARNMRRTASLNVICLHSKENNPNTYIFTSLFS